jgi:hypothetical protein
MTSPWTPEEFHTMQYALRSTTGIDMDPIAPGDVEKDANGAIHVHETGSGPHGALDFNFFTSRETKAASLDFRLRRGEGSCKPCAAQYLDR